MNKIKLLFVYAAKYSPALQMYLFLQGLETQPLIPRINYCPVVKGSYLNEYSQGKKNVIHSLNIQAVRLQETEATATLMICMGGLNAKDLHFKTNKQANKLNPDSYSLVTYMDTMQFPRGPYFQRSSDICPLKSIRDTSQYPPK